MTDALSFFPEQSLILFDNLGVEPTTVPLCNSIKTTKSTGLDPFNHHQMAEAKANDSFLALPFSWQSPMSAQKLIAGIGRPLWTNGHTLQMAVVSIGVWAKLLLLPFPLGAFCLAQGPAVA